MYEECILLGHKKNRVHEATCWRESKLPACYGGIKRVPEIITNSAPLAAVADFNSTLTGG